MKLSIIVPIYNAEEYLGRCLDSLMKIPYGDMEVLCIDDGSSDSSGEMCKSYVLRDQRFRVVRQENAGLPAARNRGLKEAQGEYISFVDSDDWLDPEMLPAFVRKMDADLSIDIAVCDAVRNYSDGTEQPMFCPEAERIFTREEALQEMISNRIFFWYMWGKVYRKKVFDGFYADETITTSEDLDSNWKLFEKSNIKNVWYSPRYQYHYFMNPASMTEGMKILERRQSDLAVYTKILNAKKNIRSDAITYRMKLYSLHAVYDILRELCFCDSSPRCLDEYVSIGRNIIDSLGKVETVDMEYVSRMRKLTEDASHTRVYFFDIFRSVKEIIASIREKGNIYIYGTGIVAKYVAAILKENRDYEGHVISDNHPNIQRFRDKPVFYLSQIPKECTLLLAMNQSNQKLVMQSLTGRERIIPLPIPDHF